MTRTELEDTLLQRIKAASPRYLVESFPNAGSEAAQERARRHERGTIFIQYADTVRGIPQNVFSFVIYFGLVSYRSRDGRAGVMELVEHVEGLLDGWIYDPLSNVFNVAGDTFLEEVRGLFWHVMRVTARRTIGT